MRSRLCVVAGVALATLAVAGCADDQPGDQNNGPGYTLNASDLLVKLNALQADPCRSAQAAQIYGGCGRYVTEIANTVITLRDTVPTESAQIDTMATAASTYQGLGCDSISGKPTATQASECPKSLMTIGAELDKVEPALAQTSSTTSP